MTLTIKLPPDLETRLQAEASRRGVEPEEWIRKLLEDTLPHRPMSGKEALEYWEREGVLGSYGDPLIDSPELARELRRQAETRYHEKP